MARIDAVWGIDIGNCSLKALRCRAGDDPRQLVAEAFDYIEYPKILTQPGAEPAELVNDALKQFLSRNDLRNCRVAVSVSGQNGLVRFIKLPPIETKKIPDIVRYEARQQIPFDLNDVIWDYQRMAGGMEEEGFALETEVGLFAMKRDQVFRALEPFDRAGINIDFVQLTPLSLFNFAHFDQMRDLPPPSEYDSDSPPPSSVILSLGTDSSDLVVTNGFRVWQRSVPIGGSHFTKALTKELKLTFAKAEHLKRNAATAQDPKAVFQAMRPVFNDLLTEIQRSISYFNSVDRAAKIEKVLALGNAMKLPGLRRYLAQSLGFEVERIDKFEGLTGDEVLGAPAFQENQLSFSVCYGLAVQALRLGPINTNLLPQEILKDRLVREKKPWALAAAATLLLGCAISLYSHAQAVQTVDTKIFEPAERQATSVVTEASGYETEDKKARDEWKATDQVGVNVVESIEGRLRWMELLRALGEALPPERKGEPPAKVEDRDELHIRSLDCQQLDKDKAKAWLQAMVTAGWIQLTAEEAAEAGVTLPAPGSGTSEGAAAPTAAPAPPTATAATGTGSTETAGATATPSGGGVWLIQLTGFHYHNAKTAGGDQGAEYVRKTLIRRLQGEKVDFNHGGVKEVVSMKDLGIRYPLLLNPGVPQDGWLMPPEAELGTATPGMAGSGPTPAGPATSGPRVRPPTGPTGTMGSRPATSTMGSRPPTGSGSPRGSTSPPMGASYGATGTMAHGLMPGTFIAKTDQTLPPEGAPEVRKFDFVVQFLWEPVPPSVRLKKQKEKEEARKKAAGEAAQAAQSGEPGAVPPATPETGAAAPAVPVPGAATPAAPIPGAVPVAPAPGTAAPAAPMAPAPGAATPAAPAPGAAPTASPVPATPETPKPAGPAAKS